MLYHAGGGGKEHVWSHGGNDDGLHIARLKAPLGEQIARGFGRQVAGGNPFFHQVSLADAGAVHDPIVGGRHHFFQFLVR